VDLHGSIKNNLASAVQCARRLRGHAVHSDTRDHWRNLREHARRQLASGSAEPIQLLVAELENELASRTP
jgi:hypothetical protein